MSDDLSDGVEVARGLSSGCSVLGGDSASLAGDGDGPDGVNIFLGFLFRLLVGERDSGVCAGKAAWLAAREVIDCSSSAMRDAILCIVLSCLLGLRERFFLGGTETNIGK